MLTNFCTLTQLAKRKETLDNVFDLNQFRDLAEVGEQIAETEELDASKLWEAIGGNEAQLSVYLLWLALNNRKRAAEAAQLKKQIDSVIGQQKYRQQNERLKQSGQVGAKDQPAISYLNGKLQIDEGDAARIREILKLFGFQDIGRTLDVEIAAGSDYTVWTCGEQTDCCMPFTSSKNQEYLLRNDTAYFVVKLNGVIIAQSVLVEAKDKTDGHPVIAIDNIEIANQAIKYRQAIAQAYELLKQELITRYPHGKFQIVIGTSYNDDGGTVTGSCELVPRTAEPTGGHLEYTDWAGHSNNYLFYDSEKRDDQAEKYFGLQIDMFDRSLASRLITDTEEKQEVIALLEKIGRGEDDGDDGLIFPDNYSVVIVERGIPIGYIIAADYISDYEEDDLVHLEKISFSDQIPAEERSKYLTNYFSRKNFVGNQDLDGVYITNHCISAFPEIVDIAQKSLVHFNSKHTSEGVIFRRQ